MAGAQQVTVSVRGLKELEKKLDGKVLYTPELEAGMDTIRDRMLRGGKGRGVKNNTLTTQRGVLTRRIVSTTRDLSDKEQFNRYSPRFNPRVTGSAWRSKQVGIFNGMVSRVVRKVVQRINSRWAAP